MPFKKHAFKRPPLSCKHGREAGIYWDNAWVYLGAWNGSGAPSAEVMAAYLRSVGELEMRFHAAKAGVDIPNDDEVLSVAEAIALYVQYLASSTKGYLRSDGSLSGHMATTRLALQPLLNVYGPLMITQIGTRELDDIQDRMQDHVTWWRPKNETDTQPKPWCRQTINARISKIVRMFSWLEFRGYVPPGTHQTLKQLPSLRKNRTKAHEGPGRSQLVTKQQLEDTCRYLSPQHAAIVRIMALTGMRPSEACRMRVSVPDAPDRGIKMLDDVWLYVPERVKTEDDGKAPMPIVLGPSARDILQPFVDTHEPTEYLFQPIESDAYWLERHKKERRKRAHPARKARFTTTAHRNAYFTKDGLRQAILRACVKARRDGLNVSNWSPYSIRHTFSTSVSQRFGIRSSQASLRHSGVNTTAIYSHELLSLAKIVAAHDGDIIG